MKFSAVFCIAAVVVATIAAIPVFGQSQTSRDAELAAARRALAAGQPSAALRRVEPLLVQNPRDRDAAQIAVTAAVALDDVPRANAIYDTFVQAYGAEDATLLKPIAVRVLQLVQSEAVHDPRLRAEVLERLGRSGQASAARDLRQFGGSARELLIADAALARLGDEAAKARIARAASTPDFAEKAAVAEAIRRGGDSSQAALLVPLLQDRDAYTRIAAIEGIAALQYKPAVNDVRRLLQDPFIEVRAKAALALTSLGDASGRATVEAMLRSPVADVRLRALQMDPSITAEKRALIIRPILVHEDPQVRLMAAEMIARDEPETARPVLVALTRDPDTTTRREAGRVLENLQPVDLTLFRQMMTDSEPWVRLYGAGGVLRAAQN